MQNVIQTLNKYSRKVSVEIREQIFALNTKKSRHLFIFEILKSFEFAYRAFYMNKV